MLAEGGRQGAGLKVAEVHWLLQEGRGRGKAASYLVIYLSTPVSPGNLRGTQVLHQKL